MKLSPGDIIWLVLTSVFIGALGWEIIKLFKESKKRKRAEMIREIIRSEMKNYK